MRYLIALAVVGGLLAGASAQADTMKNCASAWNAMSAADKAKTTYKAYSTMCLKSGYTASVATKPPAGATGLCNDNTYTMSKSHSGACSSHGGVSKWLTP
jgi:outer membrane lipoprotein-sorting protein